MVAGHAEILMEVVMIIFITLLRGNCALECRDGQYQSGDACRECKSTCAKCISEFLCTECEVGFFGEACTKNCSVSCSERRCAKKTGYCVSCDKGYYVNNVICKECPEKCTECLTAAICTNCMTGYTGSICEKPCVNCKPDSGCSEEGICTDGCKDGYSGYSCLQYCSSNCLSCNRVDAKNCITCADGKYGNSCEKPCPTKCIDNICSKETGVCEHGCQNGFWGDQCEYVCPVNCRDGKCLRNSGMCVDGCRGNFTGTKCLCPGTCECDADGKCIKCSDNTGYVCGKQCSSMCENNICLSDTQRKCFYGCREGYSGSLCSPQLETDDGKSYVTIIVISVVVVVAVFLLCVFGVIVYIKKRHARFSDDMQQATTQKTYAEGCGMGNLRHPVSSDENEPPANIGKQNGYQYEIMQNSDNTFQEKCAKRIQDDHLNAGHETEGSQFQEENGQEYASLIETCREPSKAGALVQETRPRENTFSDQRRPESPKDEGQREEGSTEQMEEPPNQEENGQEYASLLETYREPSKAGTLVQETGPRDNTFSGQRRPESPKAEGQHAEGSTEQMEEPSNQGSKSHSRTKIQLMRLGDDMNSKTEDDIKSEFERLTTGNNDLDSTHTDGGQKNSSVITSAYDVLGAVQVDGYKCLDVYLACAVEQAQSYAVLWSTVYEQSLAYIVMLGNDTKIKYWPERGKESGYGDIKVKGLDFKNCGEYIERQFAVRKLNPQYPSLTLSPERVIVQLQYKSWPDKGLPGCESFLDFWKHLYSLRSDRSASLLLHCSGGIGGTATFIAFDILIQEGLTKDSVDVFNCVKKLQKQFQEQGKQFIPTQEQYSFLYKALQSWFKQNQQKTTKRQVVSRQTVDSSYEPVGPQSENPYEMFSLLHALGSD